MLVFVRLNGSMHVVKLLELGQFIFEPHANPVEIPLKEDLR